MTCDYARELFHVMTVEYSVSQLRHYVLESGFVPQIRAIGQINGTRGFARFSFHLRRRNVPVRIALSFLRAAHLP